MGGYYPAEIAYHLSVPGEQVNNVLNLHGIVQCSCRKHQRQVRVVAPHMQRAITWKKVEHDFIIEHFSVPR